MRRQLIILGIIAALSAGGLGGVLAKALCAQANGVAEEHSCCPEDGADEGASCPMSVGRKSVSRAHASAGARTNHAAEQEAHDEVRAAVKDERARILPPESCAHCVGRPATPPATFKLRGSDSSSKRGDEDRAPRATLPLTHALNSFVPHVTPTQGSPPAPAARRHVLHSVFLI